MVIGFTGTSKGIPVHQLLGAARLLNADDELSPSHSLPPAS